MMYETLRQKSSGLSLQKACKALCISRSHYSSWLEKKPSSAPLANQKLLEKIQAVSEDFPYYGYRRVTEAINDLVVIANHKKVFRIMQNHHLTVKKRPFKPHTTQSNPNDPRFLNLAKDVVLTDVNQVWDSDITYVPFEDIFLYLALLTDRFSKKCLGWQLSRKCDAVMCIDALRRAFNTRKGKCLAGLIHHGDHGSQYTSGVYLGLLAERGIEPSMGETGNAYENPFAESMNKTVKYDYVYRSDWETFEGVYRGIEGYLDEYNSKRLHSSIGYMAPDDFEAGLKTKKVKKD